MDVSWVIPVAKEAYKHREHVFTTWDDFVSRILGPKSRIAFVGPGGVGKSVLLDYIIGRQANTEYEPPGQSRKPEYGKAKSSGSRLAITVAPGQGGPRVDTLTKVLDPKKPVDGIVFVAGGGLITLREALARETSISKGYDTIHRWQELSLAAELDDLAQICASIRQTKRVSRNPKWLLVATTKIDLLYDQIGAVKDYYSPNGSSAFSKLLNDLKEDVGRDNFEWDAVPVCSHLENFQWGNEILPTQLDASARDHLLQQFLNRLGELCR